MSTKLQGRPHAQEELAMQTGLCGFEEDREKERERKERWRKGRVWSWVGRELEKDSEQDQNTVYEILK